MALTKAGDVIDAWAEIAQNATREGAVVNVAAQYDALLEIDVALSSTTAHTGTEVIVQVSEEASGNGFWSTIQRFYGPVGTAVTAAIAATEPVGETVIATTNPTTQNVDNDGKFKFIEHATPANSEIVFTVSNTADAGDTITIMHGLANEQLNTSVWWDVDSATVEAVRQYVVPIPFSCSRARVIYNNKFDADGSTVFTRCRLANVSAMS
jgi:hypothetical protein